MLNSLNNPLKVALLSISPHNRAILEFFFAGAGKKIFKTVSLTDAEALIVDFDHPGARQEWEQQIAARPAPAIVLSVKESLVDNTIWVPKPLTSQALVSSVDKVRALLPATVEVAAETSRATSVDREKVSADISSLRALLDSQQEDKQPFGLANKPLRKAPVVSPSPASGFEPAETAAKPSNQPQARRSDAPDDEQLLGTDDVYMPEPLADKDLPSGNSQLQLDQIPASTEQDSAFQEQRWERLCGDYPLSIKASNWQESTQLYTPENYLLNSLIDALNLSRQSQQYAQVVLDNGDYILLMPDVNLAYSTLDLYGEVFAELCDAPLQGGKAKLHLPDATELSTLQETMQQHAKNTYDMEGLIWTTSLLTSHGRLSRNAELTQTVRLKNWPNLTRMEQFPHAMQLAALWHQRPGSLFDVSEWLDIPQRYAIAFYNGAHTLGLFEVEQNNRVEHKKKAAPKKSRGLFSRLLKRLLGGGAK